MPRSKPEEYENLAKRAARGEYAVVDPLDYKILGFLPPEGETFAGLYPLGETSQALGKKFPEVKGGLKPTFIATRLRQLHAQGLVTTPTSLSAHQVIWQRTKTGEELLNQWKERTNGDS